MATTGFLDSTHDWGEFSSFVHPVEYIYMERKPRQLPQYTNLVLPFDTQTWTMTLLTLLAVPLAMATLSKLSGVNINFRVDMLF